VVQVINPKDPFEQFIRSILSQHNQADHLREIALRGKANFGIGDNIDSFFQSVETSVLTDEYFSDEKIKDIDTIRRIVNKMLYLIKKINNSLKETESKEKDIQTVKSLMYIVLEEQRNINSTFVDFMNTVNKHY